MAKPRKKKRTQVTADDNASTKSSSRTPKSMVIRIGASEVGPSVSQLVQDVRTMMEPNTASRLKERRSNKLRDYISMAGPLGVSHLLLFSRSKSGNVNLRLAVTPRGPTLHFRVEGYSLCKDVHRGQKRPRSGSNQEHLAPPLLVMNNFAQSSPQPHPEGTNGHTEEAKNSVPKHLESLTTTIFQSLFPSINPTATPLKSIKRVLLLDRASTPSQDTPPYVLSLRHYAIETRTAKSVPKPLRRLNAAHKLPQAGQKRKRGHDLPNLGRLGDVADYLLDPDAAERAGFTSGSESEPETDAEVEVLAPTSQKVTSKSKSKRETDRTDRRDPDAKAHVEKKGIKLHELGPRLKLRLAKVEEGLCGGKVMWHEYFSKSVEEVMEMDKVHEGRRVERERRRKEQRENVERKRGEKIGKVGDADSEGEGGEEDWDDDEDDEMIGPGSADEDEGGASVGQGDV